MNSRTKRSLLLIGCYWVFGWLCFMSYKTHGYQQVAHWRNSDYSNEMNQVRPRANRLVISMRVPTLDSIFGRQETEDASQNVYGRISQLRTSKYRQQHENYPVKGYSQQVMTSSQEVITAPARANIFSSPSASPIHEHILGVQPMINTVEPKIYPNIRPAIPIDIPARSTEPIVESVPITPAKPETILTPTITLVSPTTDPGKPAEMKESLNSSSSDSMELAGRPEAPLVSATSQVENANSLPKDVSPSPSLDMKESSNSSSIPDSLEDPKKPEILKETANASVPSASEPESSNLSITNQTAIATTNVVNPRTELNPSDDPNHEDVNSDQASDGSSMTTFTERLEVDDKP